MSIYKPLKWYESYAGLLFQWLPLCIFINIIRLLPIGNESLKEILSVVFSIGLFVFGFIATSIAKEMLRSTASKSDYLLCLNCRCNLNANISEGKCPECNSDYKLEKVKVVWQEALRRIWQ